MSILQIQSEITLTLNVKTPLFTDLAHTPDIFYRYTV